MTDDLERLEAPIVIANRLRSRAVVYTEEGRHNAWGKLMLDAEATILSLIQRVREADRLLKIESGIRYAAQQNFLNAFANGHASGRAEALEEAAKVAEGGKLVHRRHGSEVVDMDADEIATAIRALGEKAG